MRPRAGWLRPPSRGAVAPHPRWNPGALPPRPRGPRGVAPYQYHLRGGCVCGALATPPVGSRADARCQYHLRGGWRCERAPPLALPAKGAAAPLEPPKPALASFRMPSLHAPLRRERAMRSSLHARCPTASLHTGRPGAGMEVVLPFPLSAPRGMRRRAPRRGTPSDLGVRGEAPGAGSPEGRASAPLGRGAGRRTQWREALAPARGVGTPPPPGRWRPRSSHSKARKR